MNNFEFHAPTRVVFGKDTHKHVGGIIQEYGFKKVLLHYGGGSVKKNGVLDTVIHSLEQSGISWVELGGVRPNPVLSMVRQGVELCRNEQVDFVLAVGGGSVIDSAKAIADGAANLDRDVWEFVMKEAVPEKALAHGCILTLSASGSEMSSSCVITNEDEGLKRGYGAKTHRPLFAICNPELTYTVNRFQTGCGTVDIMMHTIERYLTQTKDTPVTDRIAEGLLKTVIEAGIVADNDPENYNARAALMWAGSLSHNDLTGAGRAYLMQVHQMEHELSGLYPGIAHGAGLSALFGSWARFVYPADVPRFAQFAVRVWNAEMDFEHPENTALAGIQAAEEFFRKLNMPTNLSELDHDIQDKDLEIMAEKCTNFGKRVLPGIIEMGKEEILEVYKMAMRS